MPSFGDPINEIGKYIRKTREDSDAALRRYHPIHRNVERVRDIFDDIQPFEMLFTTHNRDTEMLIDLYFNKPPPTCSIGDVKMCCNDFTEGPGGHLIQLDWPYIPGETHVWINGIPQVLGLNYTEYDPTNGWIYINGLAGVDTQIIEVCYLRQI